jgi:hypothetical protein
MSVGASNICLRNIWMCLRDNRGQEIECSDCLKSQEENQDNQVIDRAQQNERKHPMQYAQ